MSTEPLRVAFVPGVTPDKWARIWRDRFRHPLELTPVEETDQVAVLRRGEVSLSLVRLPVEREGLHLIPLYREVQVAVLPRDHLFAAEDSVDLADLADEHLLADPATCPGWNEIGEEVRRGTRLDLPEMTTRQAVEVVASGTGFLVLPMSVARLHHRKDVTAVPLPELPETQVGLAWRIEDDDPRIDDFVGVVRGRSARTSRGGGAAARSVDAAATKGDKPTAGKARRGAAPARKGARGSGRGAVKGGKPQSRGRRSR